MESISRMINTKMLKTFALATLALALAVVIAPITAFGATTTLSIPVEQIFSATPGIEREGTFSYVMERLDVRNPMPVGSLGDTFSFTLTGDDERDIGPITFDRAGYFQYEIRSDSAQELGFVLDNTIYTVVIAVMNVPGGGLTAELRAVFTHSPTGTLPTKVQDGRVVFDKGYGALASVPGDKVELPVIKSVLGNPARNYTFTFRLTAETEGAPMPSGASGNTHDLTITGSGRAYFAAWSYSVGGVFVYTVSEIASDNRDYEFDEEVYTITDTVSSVDGQLVVDRVITNSDNRPVTSLAFINTYVGSDTERQENNQTGTTGTTTPGPKTGDYADPAALMLAMALSAIIALFALLLIYIDRRSEKEHGEVVAG